MNEIETKKNYSVDFLCNAIKLTQDVHKLIG